MRQAVLVMLCAWALAGCMSTSPAQWTHAPDDQTRARRDIYECKADADATIRQLSAVGGVVAPVAGLFKGRSMFNDCMAARGYLQE